MKLTFYIKVLLTAVLMFIIVLRKGSVRKIAKKVKEQTEFCSKEDAKSSFQELCQAYKLRIISGNLCNDICNLEQLKVKSCLSVNNNKIIGAEFGGKSVSVKKFSDQRISDGTLLYNLDNVLKTSIRDKYDLNLTNDQMLKLRFGAAKDPWKFNSFAEIDSFYSEVHTEEFFWSRLTDGGITPGVLGICGDFYFAESFPTFDLKNFVQVRNVSHWSRNLDVAYKTLDLLDNLESALNGTQQLQMCDFELTHFGISSLDRDERNVKLTDAVHLVPKSLLEKDCSTLKPCQSILRCGNRCNYINGKCELQSSNFQFLCQSSFFKLLDFPNFSSQSLRKLLSKCSNLKTTNLAAVSYLQRLLKVRIHVDYEVIA